MSVEEALVAIHSLVRLNAKELISPFVCLTGGPAPLSSKDLQVDELASAIHLLLTDDSMRKSAVGMAEKIAQEDGIATAIDYILQILDNQ